MELLKKWSSVLFLFCGSLYAEDIQPGRFTPIYDLSDDRNANVINENFRQVSKIIIEDKGFNTAVESESLFVNQTVQLNHVQPDTNYGIFVTTSWNGKICVTNKTTESFTVVFEDPYPAYTFDWILVR